MSIHKPDWSKSSDILGTHHRWRHLAPALSVVLLALFATAGEAATITVNSLADPGASGICVLRDAITAANTETAVNGCAAGTGNDTIVFSVTGTITLTKGILPTIEKTLTIQGPADNPPAIAVSGANEYEVMFLDFGATLNLGYLTIENGNVSDGVGGGVLNSGGTLTVTNSTFSDNSAGDGGGGIYSAGKLSVTNSTFNSNNGSDSSGGGIYNYGTATVAKSTFDNNSADYGGGIENVGTASVNNSTFVGNTATEEYGGGIDNEGSALTVTNSTFYNNSGIGAGLSNLGVSVDVKGTIMAANTGGNCNTLRGPITDEGFDLDDDGSCDFSSGTTTDSAIALDPNGLQNNGGPTETVALESTSVAINQIPVADCTDQSSLPVRLLTDQRGVLRPQFTACDIGAYEYSTARSLKTNVLNAINATTGLSSKNQLTLKLAAASLYKALLLLTGDDGNSVKPVFGGVEFQSEAAAVQFLDSLTPWSQLSSNTLDIWLLNITIADRTLAVVAITNAGGNTYASQLVADGDAATGAGYYLTAVKDYAEAWTIVQSYK
ncbi:MAG TPA: right-handed parallel beta-helix repeat-containing protein [Candidatus Binataceae bacterium]|nr:right-handed parallel beta-helix repeat-containing protein [Candidatus Binataceae bacterium]